MSDNWLSRTELFLSPEKTARLKKANIIVVGLGGVGAYAAEMIARAGVGKMTIVDGDVVNLSNLNRQLLATHSSLGASKAELMAKRLKDINPEIELTVYNEFLRDHRTLEVLQAQNYDYVVDAIDTLSPKLYLIKHSLDLGYRLISSMGAGGKGDPSQVKVAKLSKTYNCMLAKAVRKRLRKMHVQEHFKTVFSSELVNEEAVVHSEEEQNKKSIVGTISYMPAIFGCTLAASLIQDLIQDDKP